jgi:hypothetical protein
MGSECYNSPKTQIRKGWKFTYEAEKDDSWNSMAESACYY